MYIINHEESDGSEYDRHHYHHHHHRRRHHHNYHNHQHLHRHHHYHHHSHHHHHHRQRLRDTTINLPSHIKSSTSLLSFPSHINRKFNLSGSQTSLLLIT